MSDLVSIIIPMYNAEAYIERALKSAVDQTYDNIEIIIVDDGSTDKSLWNLRTNGLVGKVKVIEKKNGGVGSALNAGIKAMKGDWFKWLSADDVLDKNCVIEIMSYIKSNNLSDERLIFYTDYNIINEKDEVLERFVEPDRNRLDHFEKNVELLYNYYGNATTSLMNKRIFTDVGMFNETYRNGEDYEFWLRACMLNNYELHRIGLPLANYRRHSNQLTVKRGSELFKTVDAIRKDVMGQVSEFLRTEYFRQVAIKSHFPISKKLRRSVRDLMFKVMPNSVSDKVLQKYMERKK